MKKRFLLVLAFCLAISVFAAACGSKSDNSSGGDTGKSSNSSSSGDSGSKSTDNKSSDNKSSDENASNGSTNAADIKGEITVATHRTDIADTKFLDYVKKFNETYPNVKVTVEGIKDYVGTLQVRMAANELPDVFEAIDGNKDNMAKLYEPIDDLGFNGKVYFQDLGTGTDGKLYMVNEGASEAGLVYNKKAFADAGITDVPKTLDDLYAAIDKLKAKGITPIATNFKDGWPLTLYNDLVLFEFDDADYRGQKIKTDTPFTMDGPYGKIYKLLRDLKDRGAFEKDLFSTDWEQSKKDLASGKMAMTFLGQWMVSQIIDNGGTSDNLGFFPFPYSNEGKPATYLRPDWNYVINKNSKNIPAAKAWLKFFINESAYADDSGMIPTPKDKKASMPQLNEFSAWNPKVYEYIAIPQDVLDIEKKAQFDEGKFVQEAITAKDLQAVFDDYNKKWAEAKKALGK